ncbi:eukaryotic translation initiation factor 3 subunit J [Anthonomus grandis grandis]|uniref:eukaryotic translation initiation factor 3 subunit J n=1 Tax=Anthonomus grandis grandis TaxID=2921223 RepID=UPI0021651DC9|nr:eukaryotic translation initiation factor 3 subunit J [Anthonomus grandis grandis]
MESWDDENFEPPVVTTPVVLPNKWVGEDEDEDVKESWEDDDEEKKEEDKKTTEAKKTKKKTLAEKIAEKEAKKREELEKRLKHEVDISEEEKLRMQKESDLKLALETTFGDKEEEEEIGGLKLPSSKEEFDEFTDTLTKTLTPLSRHGNEYVNFTENLARNLCAAMSSTDIKKIKNTLDNLFLEKQKIEKGDKSKKNKGKGKAKLKLEGDNQLSAYTDYTNDFDEFDDFM